MKLTIDEKGRPLVVDYSPRLKPLLVKWFASGETKRGLLVDKRRVIALTMHYGSKLEVDERAQAWVDTYLTKIVPKRIGEHLRSKGREYQHKTVLAMFRERSLGCFIDAGGGKTVLVLEFAKHIGPTLVVVPPVIWYDAYIGSKEKPGDLTTWYRGLKVADAISPNTKSGRVAALRQRADIYAVSPYTIGGLLQEIRDLPLAGIAWDESSLGRNPDSQLAKTMIAISGRTEFKQAFSADPIPNSAGELWSQYEFLKPGLFGTWNKFGRTYGETGRYGFMFRDIDAALSAVDVIRPHSVMLSQDHFWPDKPDLSMKRVFVDLGRREQRAYDAMAEEYAFRPDGDEAETITADDKTGMGRRMKLRQMTAGFIYDDRGNAHWTGERTKLNAIKKLVKKAHREQWVVWCQFKEEGALIAQTLEEEGYTVAPLISESMSSKDALDDFKARRKQVLVSHTSQASHGVRLAQCRNMIFASLTYDNDAVYQAIRRIYRPPQKRDCRVYFLLARGTVDEEIFSQLAEKMAWGEKWRERILQGA